MLHSDKILAEAEKAAGIADADPAGIKGNLDRLVASINDEARLTAKGEQITGGQLVARTTDRLEGLNWVRDNPEISKEIIDAPVFLRGLPRSGTTAFQYLFDHDPRFRLIRTWESTTPFPPPGADPEAARRRKETGMEAPKWYPLPEGFDAIHLMDHDGPEECHFFLEQSYAAAGFHNVLNVPSYFDFLVDELDFLDAYRIHKRQLQLLQWRMPKRRWALKYPNHVLAMAEVLEVYPDARFVMTHRDPTQTLASIAKLTYNLRSVRMDAPMDPHEVGRQMLHFVARHIDGIMDFTGGPHADRVTHVDYYGLLDDPASVMAGVHAGLGIESPEEVRAAVAEWHRLNPKGARGANPYALDQFGLNANEVAERFGAYMQRFGIPREAVGLARKAA